MPHVLTSRLHTQVLTPTSTRQWVFAYLWRLPSSPLLADLLNSFDVSAVPNNPQGQNSDMLMRSYSVYQQNVRKAEHHGCFHKNPHVLGQQCEESAWFIHASVELQPTWRLAPFPRTPQQHRHSRFRLQDLSSHTHSKWSRHASKTVNNVVSRW